MLLVPITLTIDISTLTHQRHKKWLIFILTEPFPLSCGVRYFPGTPGRETLLSASACLLPARLDRKKPNSFSSLSAEVCKCHSEIQSLTFLRKENKMSRFPSLQHHSSTFFKFRTFICFLSSRGHAIKHFQCSWPRFWEICWVFGRGGKKAGLHIWVTKCLHFL